LQRFKILYLQKRQKFTDKMVSVQYCFTLAYRCHFFLTLSLPGVFVSLAETGGIGNLLLIAVFALFRPAGSVYRQPLPVPDV